MYRYRRHRIDISPKFMDLIIRMMDDAGTHMDTVGPKHEPYARHTSNIEVRSTLGRFLTKKGWVNKELGANYGTCFTVVNVELVKTYRLSARKWNVHLRLSEVSIG